MKKIILSMFVMFMMIFGVSINAETNIYPEPKLTAEKSITLDQKNVNVNLTGFEYNLETETTETTGTLSTEVSLNPYNFGYNKSGKFEKLVIPYLSGKSVSKPDGIVGVRVTCDCKLIGRENWGTNELIAEYFFDKPGEDFILTRQQISDLFDSNYTTETPGRDQVGQDLPSYISFLFYITDGKTINHNETDYQVLSSDGKPIVMTYGIDYNTTTLYEDVDNGFLGNSQIYLYKYWYGKYKDGSSNGWVTIGPYALQVPYNTTTPDIKILNPVKKYYQPGDELELEFTLKNIKDFNNYKLWLETVADGLIAVNGSAGGAITEANWSGDKNQFSTDLKDANGWLLINGQQTIKFTKKFKISKDYKNDSIAVNSEVKYDGADNGNAGKSLIIPLGEDKPETGGPGEETKPETGGPNGELKPLPETGSEFLIIGIMLVGMSGLGFVTYRKFLN